MVRRVRFKVDLGTRTANIPKLNTLFWMCIGEAIGCFIFIIVGAGLPIGFGDGLAVLIIVQIVSHISFGQVNPSLSCAAVVLGHIHIATGLCFILAQAIGFAIGGCIVWLLQIPLNPIEFYHGFDILYQCIGEFFTSFLYALNYAWTNDEIQIDNLQLSTAGLRMGAATWILATTSDNIGLVALNPFKALCYQILLLSVSIQWLYGLISSVVGALLGGFFYRWQFRQDRW